MDHSTHNKIVGFIWSVADDLLRDVYVRGKYRDVILPFTVLRRLDCLLEPTKDKVLETKAFLNDKKIANQQLPLQKASGYVFFNTSNFTFKNLLDEPSKIRENFTDYLNGFSDNVQEIISKFKLRNQLDTMEEANILFGVVEKFCDSKINLSPKEILDKEGEVIHKALTNLGMGYVFEELIRRFNEENNEEAGEHFTPREVIHLMTHFLFLPVKEQLEEGTHLIYDPACGSGGMLTEAEKFIHDSEGLIQSKAFIRMYGQEVNAETYAICKADMMIKEEKPELDNIAFGSTLSVDGFSHLKFDFMLSNPPYGKSWSNELEYIKDKKEIIDSRFSVGVPRSSDGQLLFMLNMISKMKHDTKQGSRIASVHNGSALFTGDAGSGESNIRQLIIENDWLEAIVQLPKNLFYNTAISTYIWVVSNRKPDHRRGKVQLINASEQFIKLRKSLGQKTCEFSPQHIENLTNIFLEMKEGKDSKVFDNDDFGYNKITVDRPLRLSSKITDKAIENLRYLEAIKELMEYAHEKHEKLVYDDLESLKKPIEQYIKKEEIKITSANKKKLFSPDTWTHQLDLIDIAKKLKKEIGETEHNDFKIVLEKALKKLKLKITPADKKAFLNAVSWKDEKAKEVIKKENKDGSIEFEADPELRDTENIPLKEDIQVYFEREVLPYVGDAWIDHSKTIKGYKINFNRYFYKPKEMRTLDQIRTDILALEEETDGILHNIIN
ncbi:type I restriction enzyme M protein [Bathymodiolus platifrons methanotrophic gill symbiont]|uniref:type I restriction-modification system subunit M n=1 Tax=Bathymodiolus platifrons methanotrophic gill symbiont TaxID=113268 RepID=UPI001B6C5E23|nr:class I SAM-dependent DNA methyltransferase [Bathymodiolus platifrons methanotrophic gill symbiont]GFO77316.1 type I restriction enzyme M protein [Bathymodiolus platifrons methanotrophic gill symbiont]